MTAVLERPAAVEPPAARSRRRWVLPTALLAASALLLGWSGVRAALGTVEVPPAALVIGGEAPATTVTDFGPRGTHLLGYRHGATTTVELPVTNEGLLPMTVTGVDLGDEVAPMWDADQVSGLPLELGPGETGTLVLSGVQGNCRYYHERAVQSWDGALLQVDVLGSSRTLPLPFDRPLLLKSPMGDTCPDRLLDRQADNRVDLLGQS